MSRVGPLKVNTWTLPDTESSQGGEDGEVVVERRKGGRTEEHGLTVTYGVIWLTRVDAGLIVCHEICEGDIHGFRNWPYLLGYSST